MESVLEEIGRKMTPTRYHARKKSQLRRRFRSSTGSHSLLDPPEILQGKSMMVGDIVQRDSLWHQNSEEEYEGEEDDETDVETARFFRPVTRTSASGHLNETSFETTLPAPIQLESELDKHTTDELTHVFDVLRFSPESIERLSEEGILTIDDLYDVELLLRSGRIPTLTAVETARLSMYLDWKAQQRHPSHPFFITTTSAASIFTRSDFHRMRGRPSHVWPFEENYSAEQQLIFDNSRILEFYKIAEDSHKHYIQNPVTENLQQCIGMYRDVVSQTATTANDCKLVAASLIKLGLLMFDSFNECFQLSYAIECFEKAAYYYQVPVAYFFLGIAMFQRRKDTDDITKAMDLLERASCMGVGEANYALGIIHEEYENYQAAHHCYKAMSSYKSVEDSYWLTVFHAPKKLDEPRSRMHVAEHWASELDKLKRWLGSHKGVNVSAWRGNWNDFSSLCGFGIQVLMLVPASILSQSPQSEHFPALLPLVPILGIVWSISVVFQSLIVFLRTDRRIFLDMNRVKLSALQRLLNIQPSVRFFIPPLHYYTLICFKIILLFRDPKKGKGKIQEAILWVELWGKIFMMGVLIQLVDLLGLVIAAVFLALWITIFVQESTSFSQNCSDWNDSTCQGSEVH
jgi:tetratricopeptide (TPR) repeat protein